MSDTLRDRAQAYQAVFLLPRSDEGQRLPTPPGIAVLTDIERFCFGTKSTYVPGCTAHDMAIAEGRRQVWLRIQSMLAMGEADFDKYTQPEGEPLL